MGIFDTIHKAFNPPFILGRRTMTQTAAAVGLQAATGGGITAAELDPKALANEEKLARIEIREQFKQALAATDKFMKKRIYSIGRAVNHDDDDESFTEQTKELLDGEKSAYDALRESIRTFTKRFQKPLTFADLMPDTSNTPDGHYNSSSGKTALEETQETYTNAIRNLLPDRKMPLDTPLTTDSIKPLPVWDSHRKESSIMAEYADKLRPIVQSLLRKAEQTLPQNEARELVHGFLQGGVDLWNARGDEVIPHLDRIAKRLEQGGTTLVDSALKRQAEEAAAAARSAAEETKRFVGKMKERFGDVVRYSDPTTKKGKKKFFLPLSENEEGAKNKLPFIALNE